MEKTGQISINIWDGQEPGYTGFFFFCWFRLIRRSAQLFLRREALLQLNTFPIFPMKIPYNPLARKQGDSYNIFSTQIKSTMRLDKPKDLHIKEIKPMTNRELLTWGCKSFGTAAGAEPGANHTAFIHRDWQRGLPAAGTDCKKSCKRNYRR